MGLLRLLTNRRVMDEDVLMPPDALSVYKEFLSDARSHFSEEPEGVEKRWNALMTNPRVGGSSWTDAYLAAFAMEAAVRLVSLDAGTRKWAGLTPEVLVG